MMKLETENESEGGGGYYGVTKFYTKEDFSSLI